MSMIKTRSTLDKFEQSPTRVNLPVRIKSPQMLMKRSSKSPESSKMTAYKAYTCGYHERRKIKEQCHKLVSLSSLLFLSSQPYQINLNAFQGCAPHTISTGSIDYITGTSNQSTPFMSYISKSIELKSVFESMQKLEASSKDATNRSGDKAKSAARSTNDNNCNSISHSTISTNTNGQKKSKVVIVKMSKQIDVHHSAVDKVNHTNNNGKGNMNHLVTYNNKESLTPSPNDQFQTPKGKASQIAVENTPVPMTRMQKEKLALKMSKENAKMSKSPQPAQSNVKHSAYVKPKPTIQISVVQSDKKREGQQSPQSNQKVTQFQLDKLPIAKSAIAPSPTNCHQPDSEADAKQRKLAKLKQQWSKMKELKKKANDTPQQKKRITFNDSSGSNSSDRDDHFKRNKSSDNKPYDNFDE